ncbi:MULTISPECIES: hypothetical protein [unclassified Legionella]|uniref:hypothetical protein n=1 Tax=unclassified Legionella TaxID=2622702 RepID=UPI001054FA9D|nr:MULTISPECIES: hypothetical protein [unclassified Legionella]MDI9817794.1 hypothetical protein [Legionella sp. PL877]
MLSKKNIFLAIAACSIPFASITANAGAMGPTYVAPDKYLLIEGGLSYMHVFYKDSVRGANSFSTIDPIGRTYNPSRIYPNNFFGGYMGVSFLYDTYLWNTRYELFGSKGKTFRNADQRVDATLAPTKLAFTLDKLFYANGDLRLGVGAGAVLSTHNKAELFTWNPVPPRTQIGVSFPGRVRLDPLVEALAMYRLTDNLNLRGNVSYQIPAHSFYTNGHLGVNLGINYAVPL